VSPFISLPTATTLPYTWKALPSTLPPSSTGETNGTEKLKFVVSACGHAAHPDEIIASCRAIQAHLQKMKDDAEKTLKEWEDGIKERELAEKRRIAPGWLDRDEKILEPQKKQESVFQPLAQGMHGLSIMDSQDVGPVERSLAEVRATEGEQLDRAFGGLR
jgi:hypothetical protein